MMIRLLSVLVLASLCFAADQECGVPFPANCVGDDNIAACAAAGGLCCHDECLSEIPKLILGSVCNLNIESTDFCAGVCPLGSVCVNAYASEEPSATTGTCVQRIAEECSCPFTSEATKACFPNYFLSYGAPGGMCGEDGLCHPIYLSNGAECVYNSQCNSGYCQAGACAGTVAEGGFCLPGNNDACLDGLVCTNGACAKPLQKGDTGCSSYPSNCNETLVCSQGTCIEERSVALGDACGDDDGFATPFSTNFGFGTVCAGAAGCNAGKCTSFFSVEANGACSQSSFCAKGLVCSPSGLCEEPTSCRPVPAFAPFDSSLSPDLAPHVGCAYDQTCMCVGGTFQCMAMNSNEDDAASSSLASSSDSTSSSDNNDDHELDAYDAAGQLAHIGANLIATGGACASEFEALFSGDDANLPLYFFMGASAGSTAVTLRDQHTLAAAVCCMACHSDSMGDEWFNDAVLNAAATKFQCAGFSLVNVSADCVASGDVRSAETVFQGCGQRWPFGQLVAVILAIATPIIGIVYLVWDSQQNFTHPMRKKALILRDSMNINA